MFVMVSDALVNAIGASLGGGPQALGRGRQNKKDAPFRLENLRFLGFWHSRLGWTGPRTGRSPAPIRDRAPLEPIRVAQYRREEGIATLKSPGKTSRAASRSCSGDAPR